MDINHKIQKNIKLAPLTTFKIGGVAECFVEVETKEDLISAIAWSKKNKQKFYILAGGSNVLIKDEKINGLVIKLANENLKIMGERIKSGSSAKLSTAVTRSTANCLAGLEWSVGIPGAIGGAIRGNAGAFGESISEKVETVEVYNIKKDKFFIFSRKNCKFDYRNSIFKNDKNIWCHRDGFTSLIIRLLFLTFRKRFRTT